MFTTIVNYLFGMDRIYASMKTAVRSWARKTYKIFWSIIGFNFINMMHCFVWFEKSSDLFFNHKTVFSNIISKPLIWMLRFVNPNISIWPYKFSSLPVMMFLTNRIWVRFFHRFALFLPNLFISPRFFRGKTKFYSCFIRMRFA